MKVHNGSRKTRGTGTCNVNQFPPQHNRSHSRSDGLAQKLDGRRQARLAALAVALSAGAGATLPAHATVPLAPCYFDPGEFVLIPGGCPSGYGGGVRIADPNAGSPARPYHADTGSIWAASPPGDPTPKSNRASAWEQYQLQLRDSDEPLLYSDWMSMQELSGALSEANGDGGFGFDDSSPDFSVTADSSDPLNSGVFDATTSESSREVGDTLFDSDRSFSPLSVTLGSGDSSANCGECGDPINVVTGNVFERQQDFVALGPWPIRYARYYNSLNKAPAFTTTELGVGWRSSYDAAISVISGRSVPTAVAVRPDGKSLVFINPTGTAWVATDPTVRASLASQTNSSGAITGWILVTADDVTETYNATGQLQSLANRAGLTQILAYNALNQLISVTDPYGHQMSFAYNAAGQLIQATNPAGGIYQYGYDANDNLISVTYPDQTHRQYLYENAAFPNAITGLIDESGSRFVTWTYDVQGRATSSVLAGGVQPVTLNFAGSSTSVTDARGTVRQHNFLTTTSGSVRPLSTSVTNCATTCASISSSINYDSNGVFQSGVDPNGNVTAMSFDAGSRLTSRTEAAGTPIARTVSITWHPRFHLPVQVSYPDRVFAFTYDAAGNRLTQTLTAGGVARTWKYAYNAQGQLTQVTGPRTDVAQVWDYNYNAQGYLSSIQDPLGHLTQFTAYDGYGHPLTMIDSNGVTIQMNFDSRGRLTSRRVANHTWTYSRNANGQVTGIAYPNGSSVALTYDAAHRLTDTVTSLGVHQHRTLNAAGDITQLQLLDSSNAVLRQVSNQFDGLGRVATTTDANGQSRSIAYDADGRAISSTDPLGRTSAVNYDALGRVTSVTDAQSNHASVQYNLYNQPVQVTAPNGAVTGFQYDSFGAMTQETSPDRGTSTVVYTSSGIPQSRTDARGVTAKFNFDALDRLTRVSYSGWQGPGGVAGLWLQALGGSILSDDVALTYDQGTNCTNGIGRLCARQDQSGITRYGFDAYGNVVQQVDTVLGFAYSTSYVFDSANQLIQETYPDGRSVSFTRDALERITAVQGTLNHVNNSPIVSGVQYRADGNATGVTFANGLTETRSFDPVGRRVSQLIGSIDARSYGYNAVGDLTTKQTSAETDQFVYDPLDRLIGEGRVVGTATHTNGFGYDANDNRLSEVRDGVSTNYGYTTASNRLVQVGGAAVGLDAMGNTLSDGGGSRKFYYSAANHLQWLSQNGLPAAGYLYNGLGQRTGKLSAQGVSLYHYDVYGRLISETTVGSQPSRDYVWMGGTPVAQIDHWVPLGQMLQIEHCQSGADGKIDWVSFLHTDQLGTPRVATDVNKNPVWRWDGEAFGETAPSQSVPAGEAPVTVNLRYPGQYFDQESGLFYNNARYYNPQTGRYLSSDPIGLAGGVNTYAYVDGNPVGLTDPFGLLTISIGYFGSSILGLGGNVGGGVYVSYSGGQFNYGTYVSGGVGVGLNVGAGAQLGIYSGGLETFGGRTNVTSGGPEAVNAGVVYNTSGNLVGITVSIGPTLSPINYSATAEVTGITSNSHKPAACY